eukprot:scaffold1891_cov178-Amphora_coffeaeformis.AAC.3
MGLFSILKPDAATVPSPVDGNSATSSSSSALPTVVQLYTYQPALLAARAPPPPSYALLTYQAVSSTELASLVANANALIDDNHSNHNSNNNKPSLRQSKLPSRTPTAPPPDLGIWNCRINITQNYNNSNNNNNETLLKHILPSPPAGFIWTVDLSPPWSSMETTLTSLQNALIRHLVSTSSSTINDHNNANALTSLAALRATQFGLADKDESYTTSITAGNKTVPAGDEDDHKTKVALMIVVRLVSTNNNNNNNNNTAGSNNDNDENKDDYETQQHKALLLYHLRKYVVALQATLVFTTTTAAANAPAGWDGHGSTSSAFALDMTTALTAANSDQQQQQQAALTPAQLAILTRAWAAHGAPIWQDTHTYLEEVTTTSTTAVNDNDDDDDKNTQHSQWVYGPGAYQQELLDTVLLRAAQYPGHWDAAKDSLWKIFPTNNKQSTTGTSSSSSSTTTLADITWLTELRQSMAEATSTSAASTTTEKFTTPEPKKKKGADTPGTAASRPDPKHCDGALKSVTQHKDASD